MPCFVAIKMYKVTPRPMHYRYKNISMYTIIISRISNVNESIVRVVCGSYKVMHKLITLIFVLTSKADIGISTTKIK